MSFQKQRLLELAGTFLHLGATAFGGPAAHIAMMERELVARRAWLEPQEFLDLIGATNLIPGPNSTELAIHIGQRRAGMAGLVVAGVSFILPAMLMVLTLAWAYVRFQNLPQIGWLLLGVQPVVIAIIAHALWKLAKTALKNFFTVAIALAAGVLVILGAHEVVVIFGAALIGILAGRITPRAPRQTAHDAAGTGSTPSSKASALLLGAPLIASPPLLKLFLVFLKIGSLVYGSGYVLLAFLREDLVQNLGWVSDRQLLEAIAIGQITPGPLFTSATFLGYIIQGFPGALMATIGIFLPSFFFVAMLAKGLKHLRSSPRVRLFLDAVNAASLALMAVVTWELARASVAGGGWVFSLVLASSALLLLTTTKLNSLWLLLAGALAGYWLH